MNENRNNMILFWASFLTLIAAGMGFSIRGFLLTDWGQQFGFTQTELGKIQGMGLVGFGVTIILFSFIADSLGYGYLMIVAFLLHVFAAVSTLAAPLVYASAGKEGAYWCLYVSALSFSLANGTCEAVINPLTANIFPNNKTHWLNILHAGWPGGLVLGALCGVFFNQIGVGWQVKWGVVLLPMVLYGGMMFARPFPRSEAHAAGVSQGQMIAAVLSFVLIFLFLLHALIGYVELGTDSWITNITETVLENKDLALLAFIWTNVLMFTLRFFAGPIVHKISPLGLLFGSAVIGTLGLWLLGLPATNTTWLWLGAVTVYGVGKTFYWPTMLGVISERFPKGGAIALGLSGGIGMISAGMLGAPLIGYKQDFAATHIVQGEQGGQETYERYKVEKPDAPPVPFLPEIAGLDNAKIGILKDYFSLKDRTKDRLQIEQDLDRLRERDTKDTAQKKENKQLEELEKRLKWWKEQGQPNAEKDFPIIKSGQFLGGKQALTWTAAVPAMLAVGFLILIVYFKATGGYKAEVLVGHKAEDEKFTGGTEGPGEG
jgi:MFS family permease